MDQCNTVHLLFRFLKKLKVIGHITVHTVEGFSEREPVDIWSVIDMTGADYAIIKDGYSYERNPDLEEELSEIFRKMH